MLDAADQCKAREPQLLYERQDILLAITTNSILLYFRNAQGRTMWLVILGVVKEYTCSIEWPEGYGGLAGSPGAEIRSSVHDITRRLAAKAKRAIFER